MKQILSTFFLVALISHSSLAQKDNLQGLWNKLLCNVFDYQHADAATNQFLRANFPYLTQPPPAGGWSMPPIGPNAKREIVSMRFTQHPFFHFPLKEGRVDFHAVIMSPGSKFETDAHLWLVFNNEKEANTAFSILTDTLAAVSKEKIITGSDGRKIASFSGYGKDDPDWKVTLILAKDPASGDFTITLPDKDDD